MKKLSEEQIIDIFQNDLNPGFVAEDVETFRYKTKYLVSAIDTLVASTDVPPGMGLADVSRKSVAACVSDFAAKGVMPKFGIISLVLPKKYSKKQIKDISRGFRQASEEFGIKILGGDTNEGVELSISVALFGISDKIIARGGARMRDLICVTGPFGNSFAGLHLLLRNKRSDSKPSDILMKKAFCRPVPRLGFGIRAKKYISSSMDSSDGLAKTLNAMAAKSRKKFTIHQMPCEKYLETFSKKNKTSIRQMVFHGGEEYEYAFTVSSGNLPKVLDIAKKQRIKIWTIGTVESGKGVFLQTNNGIEKIPDTGWSHFQDKK